MQEIELGNRLIALYKDISIFIQMGGLKQQLSYETTNDTANDSYKRAGADESLKRLSEIARRKEMHTGLKKQAAISGLRHISEGNSSKSLLDRMISKRLERANASMSKELYPDAKKNIESVLRFDPQNKDARSMLKKIP